MTDGRLPDVWAAARAERASEVGWEPPDWDATLRERRRAEWRDVGLLLVAAGVVLPLLRVLLFDRPLLGGYLIELVWPLVLAVIV